MRAADVGTHASRRHALAISLRPRTERRGVFAQAGVRRPRARARVGDTARACPPASRARIHPMQELTPPDLELSFLARLREPETRLGAGGTRCPHRPSPRPCRQAAFRLCSLPPSFPTRRSFPRLPLPSLTLHHIELPGDEPGSVIRGAPEWADGPGGRGKWAPTERGDGATRRRRATCFSAAGAPDGGVCGVGGMQLATPIVERVLGIGEGPGSPGWLGR